MGLQAIQQMRAQSRDTGDRLRFSKICVIVGTNWYRIFSSRGTGSSVSNSYLEVLAFSSLRSRIAVSHFRVILS